MISVHVATLNSCSYCRTRHAEQLDGRGQGAVAAALTAQDLDRAPVTPAERLLLEFVETLTRHVYRVTDAAVDRLREAGWSDEQIGEAAVHAAYMNMTVRLTDAIGFRQAWLR